MIHITELPFLILTPLYKEILPTTRGAMYLFKRYIFFKEKMLNFEEILPTSRGLCIFQKDTFPYLFISYCWYNKGAQAHFLIGRKRSNMDLAVWTSRRWRDCVPSGGSGSVLSSGHCTAHLWAQQPLQSRCGSCLHVSFTSCDPPDSCSDF